MNSKQTPKDAEGSPQIQTSFIEETTPKREIIQADLRLEHELTVRDVLVNHPALVFWNIYWAIGAIGWGFDSQVNGSMLSVQAFRKDFGYTFDGKFVIRADWLSAFNSIGAVGQFFGGFICSWIADRIGRRMALLIAILVVTGGILGEMFSTSDVAFLMSKILLGVGLGFYLTLAPLAISEITPVVFRGISIAGIQFGIGSGQLLSNAVIKAFGQRSDHWAYRAPFAFQLVFCLILALGLPFVPETPWYYVHAGQRDKARLSLRKLYGSQTNVDAKLLTLEATIAEEEAMTSESGSYVQCFKGADRIRTFISFGVFVCQHFTGIVFVLGYSTYFFQLAGLPTQESFDLGIGVTACGLLGTISSWAIVNSYGRRRIFLLGTGLLTLTLLLIGIMDVIATGPAKWAESALTVVYAFIYFVSLGPMAFVILGETSSTALRAPTMAIATATQAIMSIIFNVVIPYMVNPDEGDLNGKVGFIFGGLSFVATVWSYFYIPELKDRSFDEIDRMFQNRVPPRKMGSYRVPIL